MNEPYLKFNELNFDIFFLGFTGETLRKKSLVRREILARCWLFVSFFTIKPLHYTVAVAKECIASISYSCKVITATV